MIRAYIPQPAAAPPPPPSAADRLHQHADAIDHAAALGGYVTADGLRVVLSTPERAAWAREAAVIRAHTHAMESPL